MSIVLALELILVPLLIGGVTLADRRWGAAVGGWLSAFPMISAPILFFIVLEHGAAFASDAAVGTLAAVLANVGFGIGYAWSATRFSWPICLAAAFAMFLLVVFSHRRSGAADAVLLLRGMLLGYYAFSSFCIVLALTLPATSIELAFLLSLGYAVLVQAVSRIHLQRTQRLRESVS